MTTTPNVQIGDTLIAFDTFDSSNLLTKGSKYIVEESDGPRVKLQGINAWFIKTRFIWVHPKYLIDPIIANS